MLVQSGTHGAQYQMLSDKPSAVPQTLGMRSQTLPEARRCDRDYGCQSVPTDICAYTKACSFSTRVLSALGTD